MEKREYMFDCCYREKYYFYKYFCNNMDQLVPLGSANNACECVKPICTHRNIITLTVLYYLIYDHKHNQIYSIFQVYLFYHRPKQSIFCIIYLSI